MIITGGNIIGSGAFWGCRSLTSITIPDSVTSIGSGAFYGCRSLTSITIPDNVTSIEVNTFNECTSLTSIIFPKGVTSIGESALSGCRSLTSITIPDSVTSIGSYAFKGCSDLTRITVDSTNPNYKSIDGNLYSKDGTTLIKYATGKTATEFTIPNSVISIGSYAFSDCHSLTSVNIPDSVTSIGGSAFSNCDSLTIIKIPDSVTSIGVGAFSNCDSLTSITIPDKIKEEIAEYLYKASDQELAWFMKNYSKEVPLVQIVYIRLIDEFERRRQNGLKSSSKATDGLFTAVEKLAKEANLPPEQFFAERIYPIIAIIRNRRNKDFYRFYTGKKLLK